MAVNPSYLQDASGYRGQAEELHTPASASEFAELMVRAGEAGTPVTVWGAGTGLTGGAVARGGWILSTEKLDRLEIREATAVAGAGTILKTIHEASGRRGLFYPPDPTEATASIGGTIATNASGSRSLRYGATRRWVERLQVVTMDGRIREHRRGEAIDFEAPLLPAPDVTKNTAGFRLAPDMDWIDLYVGSEGALGVVTEAEVRLLPRPRGLLAGVVFLPGQRETVKAVVDWRELQGLRMLEYFDAGALRLLRNSYSEIPVSANSALLFEQELQQEDEGEIDAWLDRLEAADADLEGSWFASGDRDRERFRVFRHALPESVNAIVRRHGFMKLGSDYGVPIAKNGEMLAHYRERLEAEFAGRYVIFGHIGDAHVHVNILPSDQAEFDRGQDLMLELAREVVRLGGTVSAEHGLGKRKAELLKIQFTEAEIDAMRAVKKRLDPRMLLSPGNLFGDE